MQCAVWSTAFHLLTRVLPQSLIDVQALQALQMKEQLRDTKAKLMLQKQHDNGLHLLLSRAMGRFDSTKDALMLAEEHVVRYKLMEKSREHQEQNLQREYQGKNEELNKILWETQIELAQKVKGLGFRV